MKTSVRYGIYVMLASLGFNVVLVFSFCTCRFSIGNIARVFSKLLIKLMKNKVCQPVSCGW